MTYSDLETITCRHKSILFPSAHCSDQQLTMRSTGCFIPASNSALSQGKVSNQSFEVYCIAIHTGTFPLPGYGLNKHTRLMPELHKDNL